MKYIISKNELKLCLSLGGLLLLVLSYLSFLVQQHSYLWPVITPGSMLWLGVFAQIPLFYGVYAYSKRIIFNAFALILLFLLYLLNKSDTLDSSPEFNLYAAAFFIVIGLIRVYEAFWFQANAKIYIIALAVLSFIFSGAAFLNWPSSSVWGPYFVLGLTFLIDGIIFLFIEGGDKWNPERSAK